MKEILFLFSIIFLVACGNNVNNEEAAEGNVMTNNNTEIIEQSENKEVYSASIEIEFHQTFEGDEHIVIAGRTDLPDGEEVMAALISEENDYIANDSDEVSNGLYMVGPFSKDGASLPHGEYIITITSKVGDNLKEEKTIRID